MRSSAALAHRKHESELTAFTHALSELCRKHGLGLGDATIYEMKSDDYHFDYRVDDDGKLALG